VSEPRVLVIGQGGREHALLDALHDSSEHPQLFVAPGNPGMEPLAERVPIQVTDIAAIVAWAKSHEVDLVVIGPETALELGLADALRAVGIATLGPGREAARLESSKRHAKEILERLHIPTAAFRVAESPEEAERLLEGASYPLVVKADGLAAGKGVVIAADAAEARKTIDAWMRRGALGQAARAVIVEEWLEGEEASVLVLTDGERWILFPPARDHKRIGEGDTGPNTGGMGTCAPARVPTSVEARQIAERVVDPLLRALRDAGTPYRGVLYLGLMLTAAGPMVLEFNARFGDPEAQVVLPLLAEDIYPLFLAAAKGALPADRHRSFVAHEGAAVCVILAARGYPGTPQTGVPIEGLAGPWPHGLRVYHAGVDRRGSQWVTNGGRVVGVTARAETLDHARTAAYAAVKRIQFDGMQYRRDIALTPHSYGALADER
jgi:phosphoribosylamine--glycine ligase